MLPISVVGAGTMTSDEDSSLSEYCPCDYKEVALDDYVTRDVDKPIKYPSVDLNNCTLPPLQSSKSEETSSIKACEPNGFTPYKLFSPNVMTTTIQSWLKELRETKEADIRFENSAINGN